MLLDVSAKPIPILPGLGYTIGPQVLAQLTPLSPPVSNGGDVTKIPLPLKQVLFEKSLISETDPAVLPRVTTKTSTNPRDPAEVAAEPKEGQHYC